MTDLPEGAPPPGTILCRLDEMADPGCRSIAWSEGGSEPFSMFLVRKDGAVVGYVNDCPHDNLKLNWKPHQFLTHDSKYIICTVHGAIYQIGDGTCYLGPCNGKRLTPVPVEVDGEVVRVAGGQAAMAAGAAADEA